MKVKALAISGVADGLNYLGNDINLIKQAFAEIEISTEEVSGDKLVILDKLYDTIESVSVSDCLIIYYTGHGELLNGEINFKVHNGPSKNKSFLPISEIVNATNNSRCSKVIYIFDCCNAFAAVDDWSKYSSNKYTLFVSSRKLERAKEVSELQASIFSYCIHKAIVCKPISLYKDGQITIDSLFRSVCYYIEEYNSTNQCEKMPEPVIFDVVDVAAI